MKQYDNFNAMYSDNTNTFVGVANSMQYYCTDEDEDKETYKLLVKDDESNEEVAEIVFENYPYFEKSFVDMSIELENTIDYISNYIMSPDSEDDPAVLMNNCTAFITDFLEHTNKKAKYEITEYIDNSVDIKVEGLSLDDTISLAEELDAWVKSSYDFWC